MFLSEVGEQRIETTECVEELAGGILGVQVVVEMKGCLSHLVVNGEQELVRFRTVGQRQNGCGVNVERVNLANCSKVETTRSEEVLEVGRVLVQQDVVSGEVSDEWRSSRRTDELRVAFDGLAGFVRWNLLADPRNSHALSLMMHPA